MIAAILKPRRLAMLLAICATSVHAQTPWTLATAYPEESHHTANVRLFANEVNELAGKQVTINVRSNASLKKMPEILPAVSKGEIAAGEILLSAYSKDDPILAFDSLPFIVKGWDDAKRLWSASREETQAALMKRGTRLLFAVPWPPQALYSAKPVNRLTDLAGMRLRTYNPATVRIAELAKAKGVQVEAADLPQALAKKQLDAMITSSAAGVQTKAWTAFTYFYDMQAWIPKNAVIVNEAAFKKLDADTQQKLLLAAERAEERGWRLAAFADSESKRYLEQQGVRVLATPPELRESLDALGERFGREWAKASGSNAVQPLVTYFFNRTSVR